MKRKIKKYLYYKIEAKRVKQVASLYTSMVLSIILGIGVSVVNTRLLGPQQYGDLKFLLNLFTFVVTFLTLGVFVTGGRLIARSRKDSLKYQLIGNLLLLATLVSIVLIIALFIFSFFEDQLFNNQLGRIIRIVFPLLFIFPFQLCLEGIMSGDNRIYELSVFRFAPKILYLAGAISFNYFIPLSLISAILINFLAIAVLISVMIILFKPKFANIKKNLSNIWEANKTHGLQVYIGILAGVATAHLAGLSIGYFIDNTNVGFFSLAVTITMALNIIPSAVGTTFYRDFASINSIPKKVTSATLVLSISALLFFFLIIKRVILLFYSSEFKAVIPLAYLVSIASVLYGFGDYLNRFIGAHGIGKFNRNGAICVGISNVIGYTILVKLFGVTGAAITRIFSSVIYLVLMGFYYKRLCHSLASDKIG